jgi:hypothetical protein
VPALLVGVECGTARVRHRTARCHRVTARWSISETTTEAGPTGLGVKGVIPRKTWQEGAAASRLRPEPGPRPRRCARRCAGARGPERWRRASTCQAGVPEVVAAEVLVAQLCDDLVSMSGVAKNRSGDPAAARSGSNRASGGGRRVDPLELRDERDFADAFAPCWERANATGSPLDVGVGGQDVGVLGVRLHEAIENRAQARDGQTFCADVVERLAHECRRQPSALERLPHHRVSRGSS